MSTIAELSWPCERVGEAIEAVARRAGLPVRTSDTPLPSSAVMSDAERLARWIEDAGREIGIEAEPSDVPYPDVEKLVRAAAPAILRLPGEGAPRFIALVGGGDRPTILPPDLQPRRIELETLRDALCAEIEAPVIPELDVMLERAGIPSNRRVRARRAIMREQLGWMRIGGCWLIRSRPGAPFRLQLRTIHATRYLVMLVGSHALQYALWLSAWWLVGEGALHGVLDVGWFIAWGLILVTIVPLRMLEVWCQGLLSIGVGSLLKARLLVGALSLEPEEIKNEGAGQLLGRVVESESVEALALGGGFTSLVATIELVLAAAVMAAGSSGLLHTGLLVLWSIAVAAVGWRYYRLRGEWTKLRLGITHELVEKMVGHRTRLAQERPERLHLAEDQQVEEYVTISRRMDWAASLLTAVAPRGWLVLGVLGLAPSFFAAEISGSLAVSIGGILLAYMALERLAGGMTQLAGAAISWDQVLPLFRAASREESPAPASLVSSVGVDSVNGSNGAARPVVEASELLFSYRATGDPVLRSATMAVGKGDRILLEGRSGGGKSTLASLLVGLREPGAGLLLLHGLDRRTLGSDGWRRRVIAAPQFHENHVLMGTFAFNLLMGRRWPPRPEDFEEAEKLCKELGLGDLLERMPAGLLQNVGETGWQLSHGEQSRLFIARALLQDADLIVLDESFGALDPETLRVAMETVFRRAPALLVIAHP